MSNVTHIRRAAAETPAVEGIALADLYLSDMNPRQEADPEGIALLADSIAMIGLIQPIAGFRNPDGKVGIVAGGRRWRAIKLAIERDPDLPMRRPELSLIPTRLAPDEGTARSWAAVENSAREDLHPADEVRAFGRMHEGGASVATIARTFGTTEVKVYRRLALAALPAVILDAYKAGEITYGTAAAFTIAQDETLALTVLSQIKGRDVSEHRVRQMLQPEAVSQSDRRALFVGIDAYVEAGGKRTADLFTDAVFIEDPALLDRLFAEKLEAAAAELRAGWKWVEIISDQTFVPYTKTEKLARLYREEGTLTDEQSARYDELAELMEGDVLDEDGIAELEALDALAVGDFTDEQRQHGGVFLFVDRDGRAQIADAFVRDEDRAEAVAAGVLQGFHAATSTKAEDSAPKSPYSAALVDDMKAARLHALQAALIRKPELLLDLLGFMLSGRGGRHEQVFDLRPIQASIMPSKTEGLRPDERLVAEREPDGHGFMDDEDRVTAFEAFQAEGKKARNAALAVGLARTLPYPFRKAALFERIEELAEADIRQVWTPSAEGFFGRVSADYLDALLLDLTGCDPQGSGFKAWKAQKKAEKAADMEKLFTRADYQSAWRIDAEKKARIDAWRPDCI